MIKERLNDSLARRLAAMRYTTPQLVFHRVDIDPTCEVLVIGGDGEGAYEWVIAKNGQVESHSDAGYGTPHAALRDGLMTCWPPLAGLTASAAETPADADEPMRIEFFDWECGHHGTCPEPITGLMTDDDVEDVLRAISHAISQPGKARARVICGGQECTYYLTDDYIAQDEPWHDRDDPAYQEERAP